MKPETQFARDTLINRRPGVAAGICAAIVALGLIAAFWPTAVSIEAIWRRAETFAHGYVVVPIALWLVWRKREVLAAMSPRPFWPALGAVAVFGFGWLLGKLSGVLGLEQFALLFMIQAAIVGVVGLAIAKEIAFPLAFLVFAIPFGEFTVPWLMDHTADFTVAALQASGVPVFREGNHLTLPTGQWSVVEACSGVRYLLASLTVGTLYAYLSYRSLSRRALFIAVAILVPIVANWMRAYMIVMIGHLSGNKLAVGVDHIIYGWIFFGLVMAVMFWIGSLWREDEKPSSIESARSIGLAGGPVHVSPLALAIVAVLVVGGGWRPLDAALEAREHAAATDIPMVASTAGWRSTPGPQQVWTPHYLGSHKALHQWFEKDGRIVGLYIALYSQQSQGDELIGSQNQLVTPNDKVWVRATSGHKRIQWLGQEIDARTAEVDGGSSRLMARSWYWVTGTFTSSDIMAKALLALAKIRLDPDHSAVIVIYTPAQNATPHADATLDAFSRDMASAVMAALHAATAGQ